MKTRRYSVYFNTATKPRFLTHDYDEAVALAREYRLSMALVECQLGVVWDVIEDYGREY